MSNRHDTSPSRAKQGDAPTGENSASEIVEAPQRKKRDALDPHDFADGGGSGGAEQFSRVRTKSRKPR